MRQGDSGFSMMEMLIVILIIGIIAAVAIPQAYQALKAYRLHNDSAGFAATMNLARFRATSQYSPYRVHVNTANNSYFLERLCGTTSSTTDANCTGPYQTYTSDQYTDSSGNTVSAIEGGTQYLSQRDSFTTTNPGGATCPPPAPQSLTACAGQTDFYFNTRGMPVDSSGNPVANGGNAIYLQNADGLTDGVVVLLGGQVSVYNYGRVSKAWAAR